MRAKAHHFRTAAAFVAAILIVLIFLRACQGQGTDDGDPSASAAVEAPNAAPRPPAPTTNVPNGNPLAKRARPCGAACNSDLIEAEWRALAQTGAAFNNASAGTPLSLAMALSGDGFDLDGGIMSGDAPPIVLAGGFAFNPGPGGAPPDPGADPDSSPPGPGGPGPDGDPTLPPPIVTPPPIDPGRPGSENPPPMETPIPGALPLFLSALGGLAVWSRRKRKRSTHVESSQRAAI